MKKKTSSSHTDKNYVTFTIHAPFCTHSLSICHASEWNVHIIMEGGVRGENGVGENGVGTDRLQADTDCVFKKHK